MGRQRPRREVQRARLAIEQPGIGIDLLMLEQERMLGQRQAARDGPALFGLHGPFAALQGQGIQRFALGGAGGVRRGRKERGSFLSNGEGEPTHKAGGERIIFGRVGAPELPRPQNPPEAEHIAQGRLIVGHEALRIRHMRTGADGAEVGGGIDRGGRRRRAGGAWRASWRPPWGFKEAFEVLEGMPLDEEIIHPDLGAVRAGQVGHLYRDRGFPRGQERHEGLERLLDVRFLHHIIIEHHPDGAMRQRHMRPLGDFKPPDAAHERDGTGAA